MKLPEFELELTVWRALEAGYARLFRPRPVPSETEVRLADIQGPLLILARALTGRNVEIRKAEDWGGRSGDILLLPACIDRYGSAEDNHRFYLFRVALLAEIEAAEPGATEAERQSRAALAGLRALARVRRRLRGLYPWIELALDRETQVLSHAGATESDRWHRGVIALARRPEADPALWNLLTTEPFESALRYLRAGFVPFAPAALSPHLLWGRLYPPVAPAGEEAGPPDGERAASHADGRELEAPQREQVKVITVDEERWKKKVFAPQFESTESLEEFNGSMRPMDGSDQLDEQGEAMRELDLREVIRTKEAAHTIFRADLMLDTAAPEMADPEAAEAVGIPYDEWDARKRAYRSGWCTVYPRTAGTGAHGYAAEVLRRNGATLRTLQRRLAVLNAAPRMRPRQLDGSEIDVDAVVDAHATLSSGHSPDERLYIRSQRDEPEIALQLLVDLSLSTDGYVDGRRVLDVARESLVVLGEAWQAQSDWFGVAGFYSNTRHACHYVELKGMREPWRRARDRFGSLEPQGYTRIGPAVRHAHAGLAKASARRRCLLLITDGKPNDYDRYEGRHGIADVRQAIREGNQRGILTYALAVERNGRDYLPAMLGHRNYRVLPHPGELVTALGDLFLRLRAR